MLSAPPKPFLKRFPVMGNDRQMVMHVTGKGQGERLAADHHVPPHHEHAEQHQQDAEDRPPDGQPGDQKQDERDQVADAVLHDKYVIEIALVDDAAEHVPGLDGRVSPEDQVQKFEADGEDQERTAGILRSSG